MDPKVKSIIAHITIIGWIVALIINSNERDEMTSFFLRQTLGLHLISIAIRFIPIYIGWPLGIVLFAFWLLSLVYAIQSQQKAIPFGEHFQMWFKGI